MPKPEWGVKRTCPTTGQRFYDLNKDPVISPYTGEVVDLSRVDKRKPTKASRAAAAPVPAKQLVEEEEPLVDVEDTEDEDADERAADVDTEDDDEAMIDEAPLKVGSSGDEDDDSDDDDDADGDAETEDDDDLGDFDNDVLLDDDEDGDDLEDLGTDRKPGDDDV
ncbi:MAG: TIGR02300 family protein [Pseudomonadota bacterium]